MLRAISAYASSILHANTKRHAILGGRSSLCFFFSMQSPNTGYNIMTTASGESFTVGHASLAYATLIFMRESSTSTHTHTDIVNHPIYQESKKAAVALLCAMRLHLFDEFVGKGTGKKTT